MKRQHKTTSKIAERFIAPHKESHKEKIKLALEKLKVGATQEEISQCSGLRPDQVWKRMVDLVNDGEVFDTKLMRKLKSGLPGIVWQLKGMGVKEGVVPVIEKKQHVKKQAVHNPLFD